MFWKVRKRKVMSRPFMEWVVIVEHALAPRGLWLVKYQTEVVRSAPRLIGPTFSRDLFFWFKGKKIYPITLKF